MKNKYATRNEYGLCELFEILLFGRLDKFAFDAPKKDIDKLSLTDNEIERLCQTGIVNRIFRKWFQMNWLYEGDSKHFKGATPRQELAGIYPDLASGGDYFSVKLEKQKNGWKVLPCYYAKNFLQQNGGVFEFGRRRLESGGAALVEPQLDCEFGAFVGMLNLLGSFDAAKPLNVLIEAAAGNIILNSGINLGEDEFFRLKDNFYECLVWILEHHPRGEDNFLDTDKVFFNIWNVFCGADKGLLPFTELVGTREFDEKRAQKDKDYRKSQEALFKFGTAFDRYFLFPLDRYFGMAEIVWTEKETFMADLGMTNELLKNNFKLKRESGKQDLLNIDNMMADMRYFWFSPPTSFRLLDSFFENFK